MSAHSERLRYAMFRRDRAMLSMRVAVTGALACYLPLAGSAAIDDAVDEVLARIYAGGHHRGPGEEVLAHWITGARWLLIDDWRSWARHRDAVDVHEHAQALRVAVGGDLAQLTEDARLRWRIREILSVLSGNQRIWAEALYDEVLARRKTGLQPRGLPDVLGWNEEKTRKTAWRARQKIAKFMAERASGVICAEQRALLGAFIAATTRPHGELPAELDQQRYEQLIFHLAGCENCWAAWIVRRATPLERVGAIVVWPWGAAHALAAKLLGVGIDAHAAALSARDRVVGGGAIVGGGAATLGSKTAVVCVAGACVVGAGAGAGGEIAGALSPIVGLQRAQHTVHKHPAHRRAMPRARPVHAAAALSPATVKRTPMVRTAPAPAAAVAPEERFTPGDLPPASSRSSADSSSAPSDNWSPSAETAPPPPPPPAAASSGGAARCIPGDLAC